MKTMICLILDRSGSMAGRETDVIGGVNTFIQEQQKIPDPAAIAFVRFDGEAIERFREMAPLSEVRLLVKEEFKPRGNTPLLDAIGRTIAALEEDWKREKPDRAILMIVTDGQENASQEYKKEQIKAMIKARQDSGLWAIIYLGANVDAFEEAGALGVYRSNTAGYQSTAMGTRSAYTVASNSVGTMRATGQTVANNLGRNIAEDETENKAPPAAQPNWTPPPPAGAPGSGAWSPPP